MTGSIALETSSLSVGGANGTLFVPIVRTGELTGPAPSHYRITADPATSGADYVDVTGTITMAPDQRRVTIPVQIVSDNLSELTESFAVSLINVDGSSTLLFPRTSRVDI